MIFGLLFSLAPLFIIGGVIAAVVLARRDEEPEADPGVGTVRRLFLYGVALVAAGFAAWGGAILLGGILDALIGEEIIADRDEGLALGLSFVIVGAPVWVGAWLIANRTLERHPVEHRSLVRHLYFAVVRGLALVIVVATAVEAGMQLLQAERFQGEPWGFLVAGAVLWGFHERTARAQPAPSEPTRTIDRLYRYFGAVVGLGALAGGVAVLLTEALDAAYDELFIETMTGSAPGPWEDMRQPLVVAVVGAAVWWWHWLRERRRDEASTLRLVYLFLFGILGGVVAFLSAAGVALYGVLEWFFGVPGEATAAAHFEPAPGVLAALGVGAAVWGYHRAEQREHPGLPAEERSGPERVYRYLLAAAGLVTLAVGLVLLFATAIDIIAPDPSALARDDDWWRNPLVAAVTLIVVGTPVWARYWWDAQRHVDLPGERDALSRRVYLFAIFGAAALAALIDLVVVLSLFLNAVFEGEFGWDAVHEAQWSLAILVTAAAAGSYYWLVLREDQRAEAPARPAPAARPPEVLLFAPGDGVVLAADLGRRLGARVRVQRRLDRGATAAVLTDQQLAALAARIAEAGAERVAVLLEPDGRAEVIPYGPAAS